MTIMAGVYSRFNAPPPPQICSELKGLLSRRADDIPIEFGNDRLWIAKVDIGVFGSAGVYCDAEGGFSALTGEPLVGDDGNSRDADLATLHAEWIRGDWSSTRRTRGTFCAACYSPQTRQLRLITDRLGLRGLHYIVCNRFVVFATAFRIIERLAGITKTLDFAAVGELATYGQPTGDRTIYFEVKRLRAATALVIDADYVKNFCYWDWDAIEPAAEEGVIERLYDSFMQAITVRLKGDRTVLAFLSGGLDSRSIVAGLARCGVSVRTANISLPRTQDRVLGRAFAEAMGVPHIEYDALPGPWWKSLVGGVAALHRSTAPGSAAPERPGLIWNGEGGSCGFGHIHLTQNIVDLARRPDRTNLAREFRSYNYWAVTWQRILRRGWSEHLCGEVERRFQSEFYRAMPADPGRIPYFFLLFNDQGRKLDALHDNADLIRAEMLTPFFDAEFISQIAAANIDLFIGHKLYVDWLRLFQPPVLAIPWQSYPGHVASPVPVPAGLAYQWDRSARMTPDDRANFRRMLGKALRSSQMPGRLIRREAVLAAAALTLAGIADYRYLLECAEIFAAAWRESRAGGGSQR